MTVLQVDVILKARVSVEVDRPDTLGALPDLSRLLRVSSKEPEAMTVEQAWIVSVTQVEPAEGTLTDA